jgi:hypothetical protein
MILQAITTKFIGPSNVRGSRVKAVAAAGYVVLNWDPAMNSDDNHTAAAKALATKFNWTGRWYGGSLPDGKGNCYVCTDSKHDGAEPAFVIE